MADRPSQHTVQFGQTPITFSLSFVPRQRLRITVHPDQHITVEAPEGKPLEEVLQRVHRRGGWIIRQKEYFRRFQPLPTPRRYVSGETHLYLGRQYRLKLIPAEKEGVKLIRGYFQVFVRDTHDPDRVKTLMDRWLTRHGRRVIEDRVRTCHAALKRFDVPQPESILFRRMEKRWGSCGKGGTILLNTKLAHVPTQCIDYVITHELCHLKYPNHSREFYFLLTQCMPDWRKRKERLEMVVL